MIVDDDEHMRALLASLARSLRISRILQAADTSEAVWHLDKNAISVALVDLCLGADNGVQIISAIRHHRRGFIRDTPIVALSGNGTQNRVIEAMLAGADTFMSKPITIGKFEKSLWIATSKPRNGGLGATGTGGADAVDID